ncbi:MAG: anti-sigma factor [Acidimicrobiales bacterium]
MNHDEITQLLGAYALDAVDDDERVELQAHLVDCARCRAEVQEHQEVASLLAHSGSDAPEGLWQRIADSLEEPPPGLRLVAAAAPPVDAPPRRLPGRLVLAALTAAAVVMVAVLGLQIRSQGDRIDELQVALADPLTTAYTAALADPSSQILELTSADGDMVLRGAVTADGRGYLRAADLPDLDDDRTYQLWGGAGDQLVSLGVLGSEPGIVSFLAEPYELFAITEEDAPGAVVSANVPLLAGSV